MSYGSPSTSEGHATSVSGVWKTSPNVAASKAAHECGKLSSSETGAMLWVNCMPAWATRCKPPSPWANSNATASSAAVRKEGGRRRNMSIQKFVVLKKWWSCPVSTGQHDLRARFASKRASIGPSILPCVDGFRQWATMDGPQGAGNQRKTRSLAVPRAPHHYPVSQDIGDGLQCCHHTQRALAVF